MDDEKRWNHNLHYHPVVFDALPTPCRRALDVGCGEGALTRQLRPLVPQVVGIDLHAPSIEAARGHPGASNIDYLVGDALDFPFEPGSFDLVTSVAAVHHMDAAMALSRMVGFLRPGGVLAVVGLARCRYPTDLPLAVAGIAANFGYWITKTRWEHPSPTVWPHLFPTRRCVCWQRDCCRAPGSSDTCCSDTRWSGRSQPDECRLRGRLVQ